MQSAKFVGAALAIAVAFASGNANAYSFTVRTANQGGAGFSALLGSPGFNAGSAITATFDYSGALNFVNNTPQNGTSAGDLNSNFFTAALISNYSGAGFLPGPANANFSTITNFLASSGSAAGYAYGSFYTVDLGVLAAGTILKITHDDGVSVYQGATQIGTTSAGPTSVLTESVTLAATAATTLYYSRQNGTPSVLQVEIPEPASLGILGASLAVLGAVRRWRRRQV